LPGCTSPKPSITAAETLNHHVLAIVEEHGIVVTRVPIGAAGVAPIRRTTNTIFTSRQRPSTTRTKARWQRHPRAVQQDAADGVLLSQPARDDYRAIADGPADLDD
jgi:hypothetical protein